MDEGSQQQPGGVSVAIERTCDGRCCCVFPLSWSAEGEDGIATWLTERLGLLDDDRPLWTCRHWNTSPGCCPPSRTASAVLSTSTTAGWTAINTLTALAASTLR